VLSINKREAEFIEKSGVVLKAGHLDGNPEVKGLVQCLRGFALEREGRVEEALLEYEEAIRSHGDNWMALNNAAWQIATVSPTRIKEARAYIDRAMELQPRMPSLLDTAAEVYAVLGEGDKALELIDRALAMKPEGKMASYTLHRGRILLRQGREKDASRVFEQVRAEYADSPAAATARDLLGEIERKNLPDRPEEEVVLPPEDETPSGGTGG